MSRLDRDPPAPAPSPLPPFATVLAVEDEPVLRLLIDLALQRAGCRVLLAASGDEALRLWAQAPSAIDLLVTDVTLPGAVDGLAIVAQCWADRPGLPVIVTTGSGHHRIPEPGPGSPRPTVLTKPYESEQLVAAVEQALLRRIIS